MVRRITLSTSRSSSDQLRSASCRVSFSDRGWFLIRKKRSKLRSHISSSKRSRVLPAATTSSIHWRIWPRRNSERISRSGRAASCAMSRIIDPRHTTAPLLVAAAACAMLQAGHGRTGPGPSSSIRRSWTSTSGWPAAAASCTACTPSPGAWTASPSPTACWPWSARPPATSPGVARAEVVAQVDSHERPWWSAPAAAALHGGRAQGGGGRPRREAARGRPGPARRPCPERVLPITIERGGTLFGWVLLVDPPPLSDDTRDLLDVLAGQAATTLHNFELLQDRIRSERLTTVGRMISTIVHDFRNPMTSIRGYAAMIEEMDIGPARRKECAHLVLEETERMSAMIDEILEFTSGGTPRLRRKRIARRGPGGQAAAPGRPGPGERGVTFRGRARLPRHRDRRRGPHGARAPEHRHQRGGRDAVGGHAHRAVARARRARRARAAGHRPRHRARAAAADLRAVLHPRQAARRRPGHGHHAQDRRGPRRAHRLHERARPGHRFTIALPGDAPQRRGPR